MLRIYQKRIHPIQLPQYSENILDIRQKGVYTKPLFLVNQHREMDYFFLTNQKDSELLQPHYKIQTTMHSKPYKTVACQVQ